MSPAAALLRAAASRFSRLVLWSAGLALSASVAMAQPLPDYAQVRAAWRPSDIRLLAANGQVIQRVRTDFSSRRGDWVPLSDISFALQRAVVQSEDRRFFDHGGVDWRASAAAAWSAVFGEGHRGASTLSMQLAALLDPTLQRGAGGRGVWQKLEQMQAAHTLETRWTKAQVLEAYLNLAAFKGELVVDALARVMFQKQASGLTLREVFAGRGAVARAQCVRHHADAPQLRAAARAGEAGPVRGTARLRPGGAFPDS
ncbi:Biosynthetic peptidoglycan transglycosylase [Castellaniella defragrans]